ncbi:glycosyltransferase [Algibacter miyuki]|uniref:Glycosyltransferase n=1 Tax=Algibacter miyuki TaxID=1306933 RepID=A0ABV5GVD1_9FLAO|nr:glycosyltransferase [Algibacter miyuki]MDN3664918.1 glycosyltransferase [Algibacter miyuki]
MENKKTVIPDTLVITATLGSRETLDRTIKSVISYGGNRVKHILTCPKSKIDGLSKKYPFLEIIPEPEGRKGIYSALNNAIGKYAKNYKYVTFINDDDYWLPDFKKLFSAMDNDEDLDAVYGRTMFMSEEDTIIGEQTSSSRYKAFKALLSKKIVLFTQQSTLIKSELFYIIGGFDESYKLIADSKFWVEAIDLNTKFKYVNVLAAAYTLQAGQLSSDKETQGAEYIKLLNESNFKSVGFSDIVIESFLFRMANISIYLKRYLKL